MNAHHPKSNLARAWSLVKQFLTIKALFLFLLQFLVWVKVLYRWLLERSILFEGIAILLAFELLVLVVILSWRMKRENKQQGEEINRLKPYEKEAEDKEHQERLKYDKKYMKETEPELYRALGNKD
ncbi:hypothetical protein SH580_03950 [Coraliomargarita algicola]|uniref:Uncharacterized protein n=1 Tax=Coraliomargarita algicola TaxID=3092156 RepID=A0ABZ0RN59_9BACT|nr:hypothetical protein [Coraliomargarita sp. J2-16]WPJ96858.1 hypothetical protein SH580_03950 [Coraliomargarita sp. J2-16]